MQIHSYSILAFKLCSYVSKESLLPSGLYKVV